MRTGICAAALAFALPVLAAAAAESAPPPLLLANTYRAGVALADYRVSEKLDGVRGYWDGARLWTRGGQAIAAPAWFTAGWPAVALDGELWAGRGKFSQTVSVVRSRAADAAWRDLRYMVFDLPAHGGSFDERSAVLQRLTFDLGLPWVVAVAQRRVRDEAELRALLSQVVRDGGEGLMLHRGDSLYRGERSDDLLKLKPYDDADARVIGYVAGRGRHTGRVGALRVRTPEGRELRIGAGLRDTERANPPPVGAWISYRYRGVNEKTGLPRFASFLRVREDLSDSNQPGVH